MFTMTTAPKTGEWTGWVTRQDQNQQTSLKEDVELKEDVF